MNYEDLTPEQMEKAKKLQTPEEMLAFAREEGFELSNEELDAISGGDWSYDCDGFYCGGDSCFRHSCTKVTCAQQTCRIR